MRAPVSLERLRHATVATIALGIWTCATPVLAQNNPTHQVHERIEAFDRAFSTGRFAELADFFDRDVTIVQDTTIFSDFHDYLDRYLQPELGGKGPIRLTHSTLHVHFISADSTRAYAVSTFALIVGTERTNGVDTLVLVRDSTGEWRIRHAHITRSKDIDGKR